MATFLVLTQYFPPEVGAAPVRLYEVAQLLRAIGHDTTVVTAMPNHPTGRIFDLYRGKLLMEERRDGMRIIRTWVYPATGRRVLTRTANYLSFALSCLVGCLLAPRPDYVLVESPPIFLGLAAELICAIRGSKCIVNVSDLWLEVARDMHVFQNLGLERILERLERFVYRHAYRVNAVTETVRAVLVARKSVPPHKILWLPNGVNLTLFNVTEPDAVWARRLQLNGRPLFLYAGSLQDSYDLDTLLDASAMLGDSVRVLVVGHGAQRQRLIQRAQSEGLFCVNFLEAQPIEEIPHLLSVARAALVLIRGEEAFNSCRPAKMFPAMGCGKPLVYCGRGEGAELVEQAACGLVVPPGDAEGLASAMRKLAEDPGLARQFGLNGRALAERTSGWHDIVTHWLTELGLPDRPPISSRQPAEASSE